jgi:hypothetical protein
MSDSLDMGEQGAAVRDVRWLEERVRLLRENHFADVAQGYPIVVRFGTRAQRRFGSITSRNGVSHIMVNLLYANPEVPVYVVDETLAHELAHYAHGFGSGLPRLYEDPHRGGVVDKELVKRGLGEVHLKAKAWRETHWGNVYDQCCEDLVQRRAAKTELTNEMWETFLSTSGQRTQEDLEGRLALLAPRLGYDPKLGLPFTVEWLRATTRQSTPSYYVSKTRTVQVHGLLADRRVPSTTLDFELAYWLARQAFGSSWKSIHAALCAAKLDRMADEALKWRKGRWPAFCKRHHPLR